MGEPQGDVGTVVKALEVFAADVSRMYEKYAKPCYDMYLKKARPNFEEAFKADQCPREVLTSFTILGVLGKGGFGVVWKGEHTDGRHVAIKVQKKTFVQKANFEAQIIGERRMLNAFKCDFILKLLYAFQDRYNLYYCTELAEHGDFFCSLRNRDEFIQEKLAKLLAAQIVLALEYLQHCSILHRDLKLQNFVLFKGGWAKVADFGLAKKLVEKTTTSIVGTIPFLAPEIILSKPYGFGVDWWCFGFSLYELLFHKLPFCEEGAEGKDQLKSVLDNALDIPPGPSEEAVDFLKKLLQKDVTERLGAREGKVLDVKAHAWFKDVDFLSLHFKRTSITEMLPQDLGFVTPKPYYKELYEIPPFNDNLFKDF